MQFLCSENHWNKSKHPLKPTDECNGAALKTTNMTQNNNQYMQFFCFKASPLKQQTTENLTNPCGRRRSSLRTYNCRNPALKSRRFMPNNILQLLKKLNLLERSKRMDRAKSDVGIGQQRSSIKARLQI